MKVTVYTLTTEDDNGTQTTVHTSEAARDAKAWDWLANATGQSVKELRGKFEDDLSDAYSDYSDAPGIFDFMSWDDHEIEIPAPRVAIYVSGGVVQSVESDTAVRTFLLDDDNENPNWQEMTVDAEGHAGKLDQIERAVKAEG